MPDRASSKPCASYYAVVDSPEYRALAGIGEAELSTSARLAACVNTAMTALAAAAASSGTSSGHRSAAQKAKAQAVLRAEAYTECRGADMPFFPSKQWQCEARFDTDRGMWEIPCSLPEVAALERGLKPGQAVDLASLPFPACPPDAPDAPQCQRGTLSDYDCPAIQYQVCVTRAGSGVLAGGAAGAAVACAACATKQRSTFSCFIRSLRSPC